MPEAYTDKWVSDCGSVTLVNGDCLERMGEIEAGSIDLILCDLPYGTTACKWDTVIPFTPLWEHYKRIIKPNGAIVLTASQPFTSALVMSNPKWFRYCWVWDKRMSTGTLSAKHRPLKQHEDVAVFAPAGLAYRPQMVVGKPYRHKGGTRREVYNSEGHPTINDGWRYPTSILSIPAAACVPDERGLHPTQKPVALMEYLIKTYTNEGETVLDNCFGSCTTGVACVNTGRRFLGIEKDTEHGYFATGTRRCIEAVAARDSLLIPALTA